MAYADEVLVDSPLVYWKMDEASTIQLDSSGNDRNLTLSASTGTASAGLITTGSSWDVSGSAYGICGYGTWMNQSSFTVEAWIRPDSTSNYKAIVTRDGASSSRGWAFYVNSGQLLCYDFRMGDGVVVRGSGTLFANTVYYVALTFDGTSVRLYLNGGLDGTSLPAAWFGGALSNAMLVGGSYAGTSTPALNFDGSIDEVAYYPTVLTQERIAAHYAAGAGPGTARLASQSVNILVKDSVSDIRLASQSVNVLIVPELSQGRWGIDIGGI